MISVIIFCSNYIDGLEKALKDTEVILNLISKQQKEIENSVSKDKIRDKIKEIENDGIWITEDYYYDKELGEEYPIAQSNFSKEEMEDIVVDILKSIIGE